MPHQHFVFLIAICQKMSHHFHFHLHFPHFSTYYYTKLSLLMPHSLHLWQDLPFLLIS
jgi:hypothetical protein